MNTWEHYTFLTKKLMRYHNAQVLYLEYLKPKLIVRPCLRRCYIYPKLEAERFGDIAPVIDKKSCIALLDLVP